MHRLALAALVAVALLLCRADAVERHDYTDGSDTAASPSGERAVVERLLQQMTLEEKISQLSSKAPAVERLGIGTFNFWAECLHGVKEQELAEGGTTYPSPLSMAASWDESLVFKIGSQIGAEMRAKNNAELQRTNHSRMLNCFDPNINIARDARWGRVQETYGEDPHLTGTIAAHFVQGLQSGNDQFYKIGATCKHFAAYSLESASGTSRFRFNAEVSDMDAAETYLPAFEACVRQGGVSSIMCSYNAVNGIPSCADPHLLNATLRQKWGFDGFVVSDCGAVEAASWGHHYRRNNEEAAAATLKAGTDISCEDYSYLKAAHNSSLVSDEDITQAARRVLTARYRLGMFQPPDAVPFSSIGAEVIGSPEHRAAAVEAVEKGSVLLKNTASGSKARLLPLYKHARERIVVAGPMAHTTEYMLGNYYGIPAGAVITPFMAIKDVVDGKNGTDLVTQNWGARVDGWHAGGIDETIGQCSQADVCVLCLGTSSLDGHDAADPQGRFSLWSPIQETEMLDRKDLRLPGVQEDLVKGVAQYTKAHIIVILIHGGPLDVEWLQQSDRVGAVLTAWYPGQGAAGIANLLFGDANPSARLPVSFVFNNYTREIEMTDMRISAWPGRTYRHLQVPVLYPFGHGLSYTSFEYAGLAAAVTRGSDSGPLHTISLQVCNTGDVAGDEVVMLYVKPHGCAGADRDPATLPRKSLKSFKRVSLQPQQTTSVTLLLTAADLQLHGIADAHVTCKWMAEVGGQTIGLQSQQTAVY